MSLPKEIKRLREDVINRIAAGEVIQRPANALKELIENCLDASATNIQITVKDGGLKLLQIQDNGTGIRKDDYPIVCQRFTTSKLQEFEDLSSISTYGFRGEALASISHVAHLSITSKTKNDMCAYSANFIDSIMKGNPKPCAGNQGTIITVEDLFYNMHVRKNALRSPAEEYQKVSEVVSKYSIHNPNVGFALKKATGSNDIRTPPNSSYIENIRLIYGNTIARELFEFSMENDALKFKAHGFLTNVNYSNKKFLILLFINHRLVDCPSLKKCIDQLYATYLPKNMHPFVYMSLELDPGTVDVNVHPTKHEVHFLNEEQIVDAIISAVEKKLLGSNNSRVFYTQAKLPGVIVEPFVKDDKLNKTVDPKTLVRTDSSAQKLEKFFGAPVKKNDAPEINQNVSITEDEFNKQHEHFLARNTDFENNIAEKTIVVNKSSVSDVLFVDDSNNEVKPVKKLESINFISKLTKVDTQLTSILELRKEVEDNCHRILRDTFSQHVFVGCIDQKQSLIQYNTKLLLCNTEKILTELFYQFVLYNFQNFGCITFQKPIPIFDLAMICLELPETGWTPDDGKKEELCTKIKDILIENREMLQDYFSLQIDHTGCLKSIPILLDNYIPDVTGLPLYIVRLATEVDWESEKSCFESFARETACYYAKVPKHTKQTEKDWKYQTEFVLYPAIKDYFIPPRSFSENAAILEIANLPNLYKVFERC